MPLCPDCRAEAEATRRGPKPPLIQRWFGKLAIRQPQKFTGVCDECSRCGGDA